MTKNIIRQRIDEGPFSYVIALVVGIGFTLNLVDGFDVIAMSVAAPSLLKEWNNVTAARLGPIFSAALIGMALGAAVLAPYADKIGRRRMLLYSTILIGCCMIATGVIPQSIPLLISFRFLTGLGVGVILASGAAIASEFAPEKYRNLAVAIAITGYPFGALIVGPMANTVIPLYGWEMLFIGGGIATLFMGILVYFALPESIEFLLSKKMDEKQKLFEINKILQQLDREPIEAIPAISADNVKAGSIKSLFSSSLKIDTVSLWLMFFLILLSLYFLFSWIPTLFVANGYERHEGIRALTFFNFGAVVGICFIGFWITKAKISRAIGFYLISAALILASLYFLQSSSLVMLNSIIFMIGFFIQAAFTACYSLAARVYPTEIRTTGIGWSAGIGRMGAIVSTVLAGLLVTIGWDMYDLFLLFSIPVCIAGLLSLRFKI